MKKLFKALIFACYLLPFAVFATEINIISINDFHGNIMPYGKNPGMAKLATVLKMAQKTHKNSILVLGGDNYEGSPIADRWRGAPAADFFKELGFTISVVGNHELAWGANQIKKWAKAGSMRFLAANIYSKKTNKPVNWAKPYIIVKKAGIKIAFIGLTTTATKYEAPHQYTKNLLFKDPAKSAQYWIDYLKAGKASQGTPDAIIALVHIGSIQNYKTDKITGMKELLSLIKHTRGFDAVISAHSHLIINGKIKHIPVIQAYCFGRAIGYLKLIFNKDTKLTKIKPYIDLIYKRTNTIKPDPETQKLYKKYIAKLPKDMDKEIGYSATGLNHAVHKMQLHQLDVWGCNAIRKATKAQICFLNDLAFRDALPAGPITELSVLRLYPYDSPIITLKLSGKDIYSLISVGVPKGLQFAGLKVYYKIARCSTSAAKTPHITKITLTDGTPIKDNNYYSIAINNHMLNSANYGIFFQNAKDLKKTNTTMQRTIIEAIKNQKKIVPPSTASLIK